MANFLYGRGQGVGTAKLVHPAGETRRLAPRARAPARATKNATTAQAMIANRVQRHAAGGDNRTRTCDLLRVKQT